MAISERDRRFLLFGGGAAALLLVLVLVFNLVSGGGGGVASPTIIPGGGPPPTSATPTPRSVPLFSGRDPFEIPFALQTSSPSSSGSQSPTSSPTPTAPGGGSSATTSDGKTIVLIDTFTSHGVQKAQVQVQGHTYTVAVGQTFAHNFQVESISGSCATIDYGDETFHLCANPQK